MTDLQSAFQKIPILTDTEYEENYRSLFMSMSEGFGLHELVYDETGKPVDYRYLDVNPAFETLTGLSRQAVIGKTHNECLPTDNPIWLERFIRVVHSGIPEKFEEHSILGRDYGFLLTNSLITNLVSYFPTLPRINARHLTRMVSIFSTE
jgi:PAS domain S-box-containing protein